MRLKTLYQICKWFDKYQPDMSDKDWVILYEKLIKEELNEVYVAIKDRDVKEYIDWVWDYMWVYLGYSYFLWPVPNINGLYEQLLLDIINEYTNELTRADLAFITANNKVKTFLDEILQEIMKSNYTKTLELRKDWEKIWKVIKWDNFVPPNFDKIIEKYFIIK